MANTPRTPRDKRVIEVLNLLVDRGMVKDVAGFCRELEYSQASLRQVELGHRSFPMSKIELLCKTFAVNKHYILTGVGAPLEEAPTSKSNTVTMEEKIHHLEELVESLRQQIQAKDELIDMLRNRPSVKSKAS